MVQRSSGAAAGRRRGARGPPRAPFRVQGRRLHAPVVETRRFCADCRRLTDLFYLKSSLGLRSQGKARCTICQKCHVVTLSIEIKDLEALTLACKRLGWTFHEHQTHFKWV